MFQEVTIIGHLGNDPQMRYTPNGVAVTNFDVATSERWTDRDSQRQERTTWWRVSVWGKLAEVCNESLQKGRLVFIQGEVMPDDNGYPRVWFGKDGEARASFDLRARTVKFLGKRKGQPADANDDIPF